MITAWTLSCMLFYSDIPQLTPEQTETLEFCDKAYADLKECERKLKAVKAVTWGEFMIIGACAPKQG